MKDESITITLSKKIASENYLTQNQIICYAIAKERSKGSWVKIPYNDIMDYAGVLPSFAQSAMNFLADKGLVLIKDDKVKVAENSKCKNKPSIVKKMPIFYKHLCELSVDEELILEFLKVRKEKKGVDTETAWKKIADQFCKAKEEYGMSANECVKLCVERSWAGFDASWLKNTKQSNTIFSRTLNDGTWVENGVRKYNSTRGDVKECPIDAKPRPSRFFDFNYSRMQWEAR